MKSLATLIISALLYLPLLAQPVITQNPVDGTFCVDTCAHFSAAAVGDNLTYEWFATDGSGAVSVGNTQELTLCDTIADWDGFGFYCVVTDINAATVSSDTAFLTVDSCLAPIASFTFVWNQMEICFENTSQNAETVFWLFGDGTTDASNNQNPCHTYGTKELYFVKLRAFNSYGEDVFEQAINLLGEDEAAEQRLSIYPNPTQDMLFISNAKTIENLELRDLSGKVVLTNAPQSNDVQLNLSSFDAGVYFLRFKADGKEINERIIVR
jgi:PKD repeat protein